MWHYLLNISRTTIQYLCGFYAHQPFTTVKEKLTYQAQYAALIQPKIPLAIKYLKVIFLTNFNECLKMDIMIP